MPQPPTKETKMKDIIESAIPGTKGYTRQRVAPEEWSIPQISYGDAEIISSSKPFGPFTEGIEVTHVALCSIDGGTDGTIYLHSPIQFFIDNKEARKFEIGDIYQIAIKDKQI